MQKHSSNHHKTDAFHSGNLTPNSTLPKVSVIVPVFNEEKCIGQALESILRQRTDFEVEIIVVNDASTDGTASILARVYGEHPNIQVITNNENRGKGFSVVHGYALARGEYFHILDGDDVFTSSNKIQKQVEFLDANRDFFAVGHNTLVRTSNGLRAMNSRIAEEEWSNDLCMTARVYCHTSSLLFRKVSIELPEYFLENEFRGDTALFFYHAYITKQKCMYLPNVWSIYNFHGGGLWSSMSSHEKKSLNIRIVEALSSKVVHPADSHTLDILSERLRLLKTRNESDTSIAPTDLNDVLTFARNASSAVFRHRDEAFKRMHAFRLVDEVCESAGRSVLLDLDTQQPDLSYNSTEAVILVSGLVPSGGGVFREIMIFVEILLNLGFTVGIVSTQSIPTEIEVFETHFPGPNIWYWVADSDDSYADKLESTLSRIMLQRPSILLPFITHNDAVGSASIQHGIAEKIIFDYVYDHGLSLAVTNSSIDTIIVKTASQANALSQMVSATDYCLLPPIMIDFETDYSKSYIPSSNGKMTTASAAARAYKVEGDYKYSYGDIVVQVMSQTGGRHIHFGPLSENTLDAIYVGLRANEIDEGKFCHIRWTNQLGRSLIKERVGLFIAPFPVCSARIAVEAMAAGIPSINHHLEVSGIPQAIEFVDPEQYIWKSPEDLLSKIGGMTEDGLLEKSKSARLFFEMNNSIATASDRLSRLSPLSLDKQSAPDFAISEFSESYVVEVNTSVFGNRKLFSS